jgi:hypothetical protein
MSGFSLSVSVATHHDAHFAIITTQRLARITMMQAAGDGANA